QARRPAPPRAPSATPRPPAAPARAPPAPARAPTDPARGPTDPSRAASDPEPARPMRAAAAWWWCGAVVLVAAVTAVLRLVALDQVPRTPFYDAAVRSMSLSLHNFLYGAFDPGATASIDKPPADLWLQVLSV